MINEPGVVETEVVYIEEAFIVALRHHDVSMPLVIREFLNRRNQVNAAGNNDPAAPPIWKPRQSLSGEWR